MTGWRTMIVAAILTFLGGLTAAELTPIFGDQWTGTVVAVIGVVMGILRSITKTPIGVK